MNLAIQHSTAHRVGLNDVLLGPQKTMLGLLQDVRSPLRRPVLQALSDGGSPPRGLAKACKYIHLLTYVSPKIFGHEDVSISWSLTLVNLDSTPAAVNITCNRELFRIMTQLFTNSIDSMAVIYCRYLSTIRDLRCNIDAPSAETCPSLECHASRADAFWRNLHCRLELL